MASSSKYPEKYIHGHHASVLRAHGTRTAANSCPHLLPYLEPSMKILDIGCGPGSISCDLAALVPQGSVIGIDVSDAVVTKARAVAEERGVRNVEFRIGDIYGLEWADGTFDVVHTHQVLQHVGEPVRALREMRRVAKRGGIVSCREVDMAACVWYPEVEGMKGFHDMYVRTSKGLGATPDAGRKLHALVREAGFQREKMEVGAGTWCISTAEEREFWAKVWIERMKESEYRQNALNHGATVDDLQKFSDAWAKMAEEEDGWYVMVHGQVIARI